MRYAAIKYNDIVDTESGICVSFWAQGCPNHCKGCHNPQTWNPNEGFEKGEEELIKEICEAIGKNGIKRNFSILGGEPLAEYNKKQISNIITSVKKQYPNIKIYLWTGYILSDLTNKKDIDIMNILKNIDILIDGPYIEAERDITLKLRGSRNQNIYIKDSQGNFKLLED